ncbi:hypothetical protein EX30DRAFT_351625 [Ascodesmis nigricans]|uniref:Uncharacterized protein n=1 Tax=Ascodesmis nigricans TaxID=341454 RepID=A0A4V3SHV7_9PEZI|nr:hypothetical protein EX30DRAFT_351625 [Ascodesmis nigricans]
MSWHGQLCPMPSAGIDPRYRMSDGDQRYPGSGDNTRGTGGSRRGTGTQHQGGNRGQAGARAWRRRTSVMEPSYCRSRRQDGEAERSQQGMLLRERGGVGGTQTRCSIAVMVVRISTPNRWDGGAQLNGMGRAIATMNFGRSPSLYSIGILHTSNFEAARGMTGRFVIHGMGCT